ncbi:hypothetical protein NADE_003679 [Nannochloris sp. 'desiccata']|nr:hypothetical protein KSW81_003829 [Chlorella desiccata (nom. nud.)]KAH7624326.1 hypothetical protein NADE_003679 [Chlorella desiccata (nom. nud.)]
MPSHNEYPASSALALEIIDCWNEKDMERLLQSYHPACEYTSPRVADVYEQTDGTIGSSSGTIHDSEALKEYFLHLVRTTKPPIQCELLSVLRGNGSVAVVYERENSEIVAEYMKVEYGRIVKVDVLYSTPGSP